ncbi:cytochrome c oxidase subunit 3 [Calycomorphotria hydatis]|uniref:Cytochrome c oxidase subunit 3 n=1 Tax=Calycomorphotria hydatis TaxID=2528027 RepID=A0A517T908_9PLAN|nr:cytochrome c oxidase subunit 3 [Calycomorphotria hydatis]QDT64839.1 Cytochrome c oxidase subunit 3 [Calycomorphotria hydatis]
MSSAVEQTEHAEEHAGHGHDDHGHDSPFFAHHFESWQQQFDAGKLGMWAFLVQEVLFFSGLFCAYAVYRMLHPEIFEYADVFLSTPHGFANTIVLLFSSLTMAWGVRCAMLGQQKGLIICVGITLFCAAIFLGVKAYEYTEKWQAELVWGGAYSTRAAGSAEALITVDPEFTIPMDEIFARTEVALGLMEVGVGLFGLLSLIGIGLLARVNREIALAVSGAAAGLAVMAGFAEAITENSLFPSTIDAALWGVALGGIFNLCSIWCCSKPVGLTLCSVGLMTALGIVIGSESSILLHNAMHFGHHEEHATADEHELHDGHAGDVNHDEVHDHAEETNAADHEEEIAHIVEEGETEKSAETILHGEEEIAEGEIPAPDKRPLRLGIFFGIYYCMTGLHAIHILAGIAALTWILYRAVLGHFTPEYFGPVDFVGLYWHLVDLVWIFLFPLLYLIG